MKLAPRQHRPMPTVTERSPVTRSFSRRGFLKHTAAVAIASSTGARAVAHAQASEVDAAVLGRSHPLGLSPGAIGDPWEPCGVTNEAVARVGSATQIAETGRPSRTSIVVCARRALPSFDPWPSFRNPDYVAWQFLGPEERRLVADNPAILALDMDYERGRQVSPELAALHLIRTKYIDAKLKDAVRRGAAQIVILGAGFDSRAYRLRRDVPKDTRFYEVDFGPTQQYKKRRVEEIFMGLPTHVTYVPIDFTREKLDDVLANAGFRKDQMTFFIWEGVTYYIPDEAIRETLRFVAGTAPQSSIVFDAKHQSMIELVGRYIDAPQRAPREWRAYVTMLRMFRDDWHEPFLFGFPDGQEGEYCSRLGLDLRHMLLNYSPQAKNLYLTRPNGEVPYSIRKQKQHAPSQSGFIAEAMVPPR
jgi:methyltransferase (TIGR00027 family)